LFEIGVIILIAGVNGDSMFVTKLFLQLPVNFVSEIG
jgi:hypothetical protein